jgi:hypothetical protein
MQVPNLANTILTFRHPPLLDCSAEPSPFLLGTTHKSSLSR